MGTDIIERGTDKYQIVALAQKNEVEVVVYKNDQKVADYSGSATIEVATAFQGQVGERLLSVMEQLARDDIHDGKLDHV